MDNFKLKLYKKGYASKLIRGIEDPRPWNLEEEIRAMLTKNSVMLDIGSGDARKLLNHSKDCKKIIALEPSLEMRNLANVSINKESIFNIEVTNGTSENLPFPANTFNVVSCMLAPWNAGEVLRVLKPGGYFINEAIGSTDKIDFKKQFGKDKDGNWRGSLINFCTKDFISQYKKKLELRFSSINIREGYWNTYYSMQGLIELCQHTSTIKNFDLITDHFYLNLIANKFMTSKGIKLTQNRLLITAKKPFN